MKSRIEVARYIEHQLSNKTNVVADAKPYNEYYSAWHYGLLELKQLMDYIYELPAIPPQYILRENIYKLNKSLEDKK